MNSTHLSSLVSQSVSGGNAKSALYRGRLPFSGETPFHQTSSLNSGIGNTPKNQSMPLPSTAMNMEDAVQFKNQQSSAAKPQFSAGTDSPVSALASASATAVKQAQPVNKAMPVVQAALPPTPPPNPLSVAETAAHNFAVRFGQMLQSINTDDFDADKLPEYIRAEEQRAGIKFSGEQVAAFQKLASQSNADANRYLMLALNIGLPRAQQDQVAKALGYLVIDGRNPRFLGQYLKANPDLDPNVAEFIRFVQFGSMVEETRYKVDAARRKVEESLSLFNPLQWVQAFAPQEAVSQN